METQLSEVVKRLHFGADLVGKAKKIKAKTNYEFLLKLFTEEAEERDRKRRNALRKAAGFDIEKTFEKYTFEDIKFPAALCPEDLLKVSFVPRKENVILYGTVGAGKTHLAIAMVVAACDAGFRTKYWRTPALVNALIEAKKDGCLSKFMRQFDKLDLLICDEWGYVPIENPYSIIFKILR
jgi:DNA replication protein DnaC